MILIFLILTIVFWGSLFFLLKSNFVDHPKALNLSPDNLRITENDFIYVEFTKSQSTRQFKEVIVDYR